MSSDHLKHKLKKQLRYASNPKLALVACCFVESTTTSQLTYTVDCDFEILPLNIGRFNMQIYYSLFDYKFTSTQSKSVRIQKKLESVLADAKFKVHVKKGRLSDGRLTCLFNIQYKSWEQKLRNEHEIPFADYIKTLKVKRIPLPTRGIFNYRCEVSVEIVETYLSTQEEIKEFAEKLVKVFKRSILSSNSKNIKTQSEIPEIICNIRQRGVLKDFKIYEISILFNI